MSINSIQWTAMSNSMHNGNVGDVVNTMEDKALEYAKANNVSKDEALDILVEQYKENTNYDFYEDVQTYSKDIKSDFWAGFVDGLDFLNLFNTTSTQQALNDLANVEPSSKEKWGKALGGLAVGLAGFLIGGGTGLLVKQAVKTFMIAGGIGAAVTGGPSAVSFFINPAQNNAGEADFTPTVVSQPADEATTVEDADVDTDETVNEEISEETETTTENPFEDFEG